MQFSAPQARPAGAERGNGVPASDGDGGSGGANPPVDAVQRAAGAPAGAERGDGVPASDGDGGSGGAKPPGLMQFSAPQARPPERSGAMGSPRATAMGGPAGRSPPE